MASLTYDDVHKVFDGDAVAMADVTLRVEDGEFMVFVGPSGSGKSTFLRIMAGLESPTQGRVLVDDEDVTDLEPQDRNLAMVFQAYALYPHKTVRQNLEFGLRMRGTEASRRRERVERVARTLDIADLLDRKPGQLSGGQRQRVALGRALVREPEAFLLDEPLSNLDPALRLSARAEFARLHQSLDTTFLYVTHDQEEAVTLGDRVAVVRHGRIEQVAPPMELYRRPATRFVAEFIGSPSMNVLPCRVGRAPGADSSARLEGPGFTLDLEEPPEGLGEEVLVGVRPHDVERVDRADDAVVGQIELVEPRGSDQSVRLRLGSGQGLEASGDEGAVLTVVLPPDVEAREGEPMMVRLPDHRLHFFDPHDETRIDTETS